MKRFLFCIILLLPLPGCQSSTAVVVEHFENLDAIASSRTDRCENMAVEIGNYLDKYGAEFSSAVRNADQADPADAHKIFDATERLSVSMAQCPEDTLRDVRQRLADIIFVRMDDGR